eukprot:g54697.t1
MIASEILKYKIGMEEELDEGGSGKGKGAETSLRKHWKTYPANTLTTQNTSLSQKLPSQSKNRNKGEVRGVMVTTSPCST